MQMDNLNPNEKYVWSHWETKTSREVVREAAAKGVYITLAYKYLEHKNGWDNATAKEWFTAEVFAWVLQLLSMNQFFKASHVLNKINVSPSKHILTIAFESTDKKLRDYISDQLVKTADDLQKDSQEEWQNYLNNWNLLKLLEKSFDIDGIPKQNKVFGSGKDIVVVTLSDVKHITVKKFSEMSSESKKKIATNLFIDNFDLSVESFIEPESLWNILLQRNMPMILKRWITLFYNPTDENLNKDKHLLKADSNIFDSPESLKKVDSLLLKWPITETMINSISESSCFEFTKLYTYDTLCSFGVIIDAEKSDVKSILQRLCRTKNLGCIESVISKNNDFNDLIVQYCINHNLLYAMTVCFNEERSSFNFEDITKNGTQNCLDLWLLYKHINKSKDVKMYIYSIYETCKYLSKDNLPEYLSDNHDIIIAMLLFENRNLYEIFNEDQSLDLNDIKFKWSKNLASSLPHLYSMYQRWQNNSFAIKNDVNVYQLLSAYQGLDISKVFEYQISQQQSKSVSQSIEKFMEPPHFDNKQLVQKYGYNKKLNYHYYLKQNRPCSASQSFMIRQYQSFNRLNAKDIRDTCNNAHSMALQNWNNPIITSACVSFISMIGSDSIKCRTHISIIKQIESYLENVEKMDRSSIAEKINRLIDGLIKNCSDTISLILMLLINYVESVLESLIDKEGSSDFGRIIYEWQTVIKFAYFHSLPLPEQPLIMFVTKKDWLSFLMFANLFKYPQKVVLKLCQQFDDKFLVEHMTHAIIYNKIICASEDVTLKSKRMDRQQSFNLMSDSLNNTQNELDFSIMSNDLWDIISKCHGPDDPPRALLKASSYFHSPILALIATCYEPDAVDVCWAQWMITSMSKDISEPLISSNEFDIQNMTLTEEQMLDIMKTALEFGYYRMLHESLLIFYKESPLCLILKFIVKTAHYFQFDSNTIEILRSCKNMCGRRPSISISERSWLPKFMRNSFVQTASVKLLVFALCKCFKSIWHQKEFIDCICQVGFDKNCNLPCPDFNKLKKFLTISMKCGVPLMFEKICDENSTEAQIDYVNTLIDKKFFDESMDFANVANLCKDDIFIAEWTEKYIQLLEKIGHFNTEVHILKFWAECSFTMRKNKVNVKKSVEFLKKNCDLIKNKNHRFYVLRLILGCFEEFKNLLDSPDSNRRDSIEHEMWKTFLESEDSSSIFLASIDDTFNYILELNVDSNDLLSENISTSTSYKWFNLNLVEIKMQANLSSMSIVDECLSSDESMKLIRCIECLLDNGLIAEAWRINKLFKVSQEYTNRTKIIEIVESCLMIAEGSLSPYELTDIIRSYVTLPDSQLSDGSIEELVIVSDKEEDGTQLAGKKDADTLTVLDTVAVRLCCKLLKQISDYYRIALQIGWTYDKVLKYDGNPLELINFLSGRSRMPLSKIVLRTYEIQSQKVMDYLSLEIANAIISSHLTRTSGFKQKEYFRYTLWGYPLDTDFEMFLSMCPDKNAVLGKLLLEYLSAFRKLCKCSVQNAIKTPDDSSPTNASNEDYHDIEQEEVESGSEYGESTISSILPLFKAFTRRSNENLSTISSSTATKSFILKKKDRRPQLDIISCTNIRISPSVKSNIMAIMKNTKLSTKEINVISIELLVLAHECFSSVCDTEGIATILRSAQTLTSQMLAARSWRLMVRLLTGIARYTEMAYIFQILRDNDQFEFLLGQFSYILGRNEEKINNFKLGLLEFLKKHCPGDTDIYCMVALHFLMFSEAADVKKKQANDLIVATKQMALDSMKVLKKRNTPQPEWIILAENDSTRLLLDTALVHCSEGAELYAKAGCYGAARETAAFAQLIALQISLLRKPPTKCLFDLNHSQKRSVLESYLGFMEGLVYANTSDVGASGWISEWKDIVYERVIKGDQPFTKDIGLYRPDIAVYVIERFDLQKDASTPDPPSIFELRQLFKLLN